jgi:triosephosphate isomerase
VTRRKPLLAGNWKMNLDRRAALELALAVRARSTQDDAVDLALFPPFVYLAEVCGALAGSRVRCGGQTMCEEASGAFTGETSGAMLRDVGCELVLLGHSERRHVYGESDARVKRKLRAALELGLDAMLCVGETLDERKAKRTEEVVRRQLVEALAGVSAAEMARVSIAYEPVWAIGTGVNASAEQAGEVHVYLRGLLAGLYEDELAERTRILYGGSVKGENIAELMRAPGVDGALVGGASLKAASFQAILDGIR